MKYRKKNLQKIGLLVGNGMPPSRLGDQRTFSYLERFCFKSSPSDRVVDVLSTPLKILQAYRPASCSSHRFSHSSSITTFRFFSV